MHANSASGHPLNVLNTTILPIRINGFLYQFPIHVIENLNTKAILGMDFLTRFNATIDAKDKSVSFPSSAPEFNVFSSKEISIPPHSVQAVAARCSLTGLGYVFTDILSIDEKLFDNPGTFSISVHNPTHVALTLPKNFPLAEFVPCLQSDVMSISQVINPASSPNSQTDSKLSYAQVTAINSPGQQAPSKNTKLRIPPLSKSKQEYLKKTLKCDLADKTRLLKLLFQYHDCISENKHDLGLTTKVQHKIDLKSPEPIHKKQFRIPEEHLPYLYEYVENLEKSGCIQVSQSPFNSPIFLVKKPHTQNEYRLVQDCRALNANTVEKKYAMKEIQDYIDEIGRSQSRIFSKMDLTSGYWQQSLEPNSRPYTAFTVPGKARYEWRVCAQGLSGSPSSFAILTTALVNGIQGCQSYLDDILCTSQTEDSHFTRLELLFQRLREFNLKLNLKKSHFFAHKMDFLGHEISADGFRVSDEKVKAIKEYPEPTSIKKVRQFSGLANYFRNFIPNYAQTSGHLSKLLRKDSNWKKGPLPLAAKTAFSKIKQILSSAPMLAYPLPNTPYILSVDAATGDELSPGGLGAILSQIDKDGQEKIVSFASRSLKEHEKNYTAFLLELQAAVWAIDHFSVYLTGRKFTLLTDSKPVEKLSKMHTKTFHRLQQLMNEYDFIVQYRKGSANAAPDALSRNPVDSITADQTTAHNLRKFQQTDPQIKALFNFLRYGKLPSDAKLQKFVATYGHISLLKDNIVFTKVKVNSQLTSLAFAPTPWRLPLITEAHAGRFSGHRGIHKTISMLLLKYFWPGMTSQTTEFIKKCPVCLKVNRPNFATLKQPLTPLPISTKPNHRVHLDLVGPLKSTSENSWILCCTDSFTKFSTTTAIKNKEAKTVAQAFLKDWLFKFGPPESLLTDGGGEFKNQLFDQIALLSGIKTITTSPFHPATNGICERFNRTLIRILTSLLEQNQKSSLHWEELLPIATFSYNVSVHKQTTYSPFFLTFLHHPNLPFFDHDFDNPIQSWPEDIFDSVHKIYDDVQKQLNDKIPQSHGKFRQFQVGDQVLVSFPKQLSAAKQHPVGNKKFQTQFHNNYKIIKKISPSAFHVKRPYGRPLVVNAERLKLDTSLPPSSRPVTRSMAKVQLIQQKRKQKFIFFDIDLHATPPNDPNPQPPEVQPAAAAAEVQPAAAVAPLTPPKEEDKTEMFYTPAPPPLPPHPPWWIVFSMHFASEPLHQCAPVRRRREPPLEPGLAHH